MSFGTILSVDDLRALLDGGADVFIADCEFDLGDPGKGRRVHAEGHIPGAHYLHLDEDLAAKPEGTNGRHPLPTREAFAARMRALGLKRGQQVIAYDGAGNPYAARLWWMLKWLGHEPVAVLDGGRAAWIAAGLPLTAGEVADGPEGDFTAANPLLAQPVDAAAVLANITAPDAQLLDARAPDRFAGQPNPLDPVPGHIPGARCRFFRDNLTPEGRFKAPAELAADFAPLLDGKPALLSCGSGVTACHNALAMEIAGLSSARLYPGSWSEWISAPARPVETGGG